MFVGRAQLRMHVRRRQQCHRRKPHGHRSRTGARIGIGIERLHAPVALEMLMPQRPPQRDHRTLQRRCHTLRVPARRRDDAAGQALDLTQVRLVGGLDAPHSC
ncbi:hypothetical protein ACU686_35630 [Yinghuangia aomiensis]